MPYLLRLLLIYIWNQKSYAVNKGKKTSIYPILQLEGRKDIQTETENQETQNGSNEVLKEKKRGKKTIPAYFSHILPSNSNIVYINKD